MSTYITGPDPKLGQLNYPHPDVEYDELDCDDAEDVDDAEEVDDDNEDEHYDRQGGGLEGASKSEIVKTLRLCLKFCTS